MNKLKQYLALVLAIAFYSSVGICTRYASMHAFLSWPYILFVAAAVAILGIYAIVWQQIIQRVSITTAYMFRGLGIVFTLLMCYFIFAEEITRNNLIGSAIIIAGVTLFSALDAKQKNERKEVRS